MWNVHCTSRSRMLSCPYLFMKKEMKIDKNLLGLFNEKGSCTRLSQRSIVVGLCVDLTRREHIES